MEEVVYTKEQLIQKMYDTKIECLAISDFFIDTIMGRWENTERDLVVMFHFMPNGSGTVDFYKHNLKFHTIKGTIDSIVEYFNDEDFDWIEAAELTYKENAIKARAKSVVETIKDICIIISMGLYTFFIGLPIFAIWELFVLLLVLLYTAFVPFNIILWVLTGYQFYKTSGIMFNWGTKIMDPFDWGF